VADVADILDRMVDEMAQLLMRIGELERKLDNSVRHGKVTDVDTKKQLARIEIGEKDGKPLKSAWLPYAQLAGEFKAHRPPTKGQQLTMFAPNGEVRQAVLLPFTWSEQNPSPSDKEDEHVTTFGQMKIVEKKDSVTLSVGQASIEIKNGAINIKATKVFTVGKTYLGVDSANEEVSTKLEILTEIPTKQTYAKQ